MLVWALWSWKAANNMAGATSAKLNGILDKLDSKINTLQTENINGVLAEVQGAIADLRKTARRSLVTAVAAPVRRDGSGNRVPRPAQSFPTVAPGRRGLRWVGSRLRRGKPGIRRSPPDDLCRR